MYISENDFFPAMCNVGDIGHSNIGKLMTKWRDNVVEVRRCTYMTHTCLRARKDERMFDMSHLL